MLPALIFTSLALQAPPPAVWIEGESATSASPEFKKAGWGRDLLSGKSWLFAAIDGAERELPLRGPRGGEARGASARRLRVRALAV